MIISYMGNVFDNKFILESISLSVLWRYSSIHRQLFARRTTVIIVTVD